MSPTIRASYEGEDAIRSIEVRMNLIPDYCPICHQGIEPIRRYGWCENKKLYVIFQCPKKVCRVLFFGLYYEQISSGVPPLVTVYKLMGCSPKRVKEKIFQDTIMNISKKFFVIYNQAKEAEERGLKEICGAGYRRALEFLIKDYLKKENVEKPEIIEKTRLYDCIKLYIKSGRIKDCAKRAVWLGNDETHYIRKWKSKDLEDLKNIIELTGNWIHDEHLTKKITKDMPEKRLKAIKKKIDAPKKKK